MVGKCSGKGVNDGKKRFLQMAIRQQEVSYMIQESTSKGCRGGGGERVEEGKRSGHRRLEEMSRLL